MLIIDPGIKYEDINYNSIKRNKITNKFHLMIFSNDVADELPLERLLNASSGANWWLKAILRITRSIFNSRK